MQYFKLNDVQRQQVMESLAGMKNFLFESFGSLTLEETCVPGPGNSFSPVEQVWHLADLEREGFGFRIRALQSGHNPHLPDFDGDGIALERNYRSLALQAGLQAFSEAREANLTFLKTLAVEDWSKSGSQDGVGEVSLCDMPVFISQHDRAHIEEILAWKKFAARQQH